MKINKIILALSVSLILASSLLASVIVAATTEDTIFRQIWGKTLGLKDHTDMIAPNLESKSLVLGPANFVPYRTGVPYNRLPDGSSMWYAGEFVSTGETFGTFFATVQLPQGANVTQLRFIGTDSNTDESAFISIRSYDPLNSTQRLSTLATAHTPEGFGGGEFDVSTTEIQTPTIDTYTYMYHVVLQIPLSSQFYGAIIYYEN